MTERQQFLILITFLLLIILLAKITKPPKPPKVIVPVFLPKPEPPFHQPRPLDYQISRFGSP